MASNRKIQEFFGRVAQPTTKVPPPPQIASSSSSINVPAVPTTPSITRSSSQSSSTATKVPARRAFSSNLSTAANTQPPSVPVTTATEIKDSDDESSNSDSSIEELWPRPISTNRYSQAIKPAGPSTPPAPRFRNASSKIDLSPLPMLSKYKFDLKSLVSDAENDEATETSSKRIKAMLAIPNDENQPGNDGLVDPSKLPHASLLESVVAQKEDGGMQKVSRALMRTEATNVEKSWYFFDTGNQPNPSRRREFPTASIKENWALEFSDPTFRNHTFVSGLAEDMVYMGRSLPRELFLWLIDEACFERNDVLRTSYFNVLIEALKHNFQLLSLKMVDWMLLNVGGTSAAIALTEKIKLVPLVSDPYPKHDWSILRSVIQFLGQIADFTQQDVREHILCLLLRMSVDDTINRNTDILATMQNAIRQLCKHIPSAVWESSCQNICKSLFESVEQSTLRLKIVESISCIKPRTHELRRRLAMCFYFNNIKFSQGHPFTNTNINTFIDRLEEPAFQIKSQTDYQELASLIYLMDIAVDDGRSVGIDLTNKDVATRFDIEIEALVYYTKHVLRSIGNPGAAFISRIEAKESLELVSQRMSDTLRSKPMVKLSHFAVKREGSKAVMSAFLSRDRKKT